MQDITQQNSAKTLQDILENGFVSLSAASSRCGYTTDHLRRLIRAGQIEAIRHGSKGNLYVKNESLEKYQYLVNQSRFLAPKPVLSSVPLMPVKGSLNAEPQISRDIPRPVLQRNYNAVSGFLTFLGGILFLILSIFF